MIIIASIFVIIYLVIGFVIGAITSSTTFNTKLYKFGVFLFFLFGWFPFLIYTLLT